ncbi:YtxH domain-containing protein [Dehalobacter sp. 4CP]|uniref:YtxH domain-containing protein n=1 Tax=Dehalobacter sp. CP TaxID=2594474 RepID=UPI0039EB82E7|nr:YtxH domain-containing protein [Dehalobacter sp.]
MIFKDLLLLVNKEKRERERVKAAQKIAVGMGAAVAVGVATGILFAPKSGKETRRNIKNNAINAVESIKDTV